MTTIVTVLTEDFSDWEIALLNAAARSHYGVDTRYATPGGTPVVSAAGLRITPDLAVEDIDAAQLDALVVCGGPAWTSAAAPDIKPIVIAARDAGKTVAGICDGTVVLARAGVLDTVAHTSNSPENLPPTGYAGSTLYRDQPQAVRDGKIVTAPGTAPVSFMGEVMETLGLRNGELDFYIGLHGAEHRAA